MTETNFLNSVFNLIEFILQCELRNTSKILIRNYISESHAVKMSDKARDAIKRYTQEDLSSLNEIREKSKEKELSSLDHLILKMEFIARELSQ